MPVFVPAFPPIVATIRDDSSGELIVNGTALPLQADSVALLRAGVIARCSATARRVKRPVRIQVTDVAGSYKLAIHPDAYVQVLNTDGTVPDPPSADLRIIGHSPCRHCHTSTVLNSIICPDCGIQDPHNVQTAPASARPGSDTNVIDTALVDELLLQWSAAVDSPPRAAHDLLEENSCLVTRSPQRSRPQLHFDTGQTVTIESTALLGRKPTPDPDELVAALISVIDHSFTVSKTHLLLEWLDSTLWVTDRHSANGVDLQRNGDSPTVLEPDVPFQLRDGDQVVLGELRCTVSIETDASDRGGPHE